MRHSSLSFAAVLLFSTIVIAQHHEAGSAPSPPPPSPAPSAAPAPAPPAPPPPAPAPAPSPAPAPVVTHVESPGPTPSPAISHISAPSGPATVSIPETHAAPTPSTPSSHASGLTLTEPGSSHPAPATRSPQSDARGVIPGQKISSESTMVSAPRMGENPPVKDKPAPDFRRRICLEGLCNKEAAVPQPPGSDLRHRVCLSGPCPCPAGQSWSKNACTPTAAVVPPADQCQPGEIWNGAACQPSSQCMAGQVWNGTGCVPSSGECASIDSRGAILINELRGLKAQIQQACGQNPPAQDCDDLKLQQSASLLRYRMLLTEAPTACLSRLPDPTSLD